MFFCTKPHATGTQQIFCTSFHSSCWLHQITTVHCLTNSAVACWRCCCHCLWSPSSSHDLHCMVFGQASFTDFWEINFGLIVLISFLYHQSGVLSFGLHTSSKPVISSAWHFDLFWQSTRHIKWNDLLFCECSLAWVNKSLREIKKITQQSFSPSNFWFSLSEYSHCYQDRPVISLDTLCQFWEVISSLFIGSLVFCRKMACENCFQKAHNQRPKRCQRLHRECSWQAQKAENSWFWCKACQFGCEGAWCCWQQSNSQSLMLFWKIQKKWQVCWVCADWMTRSCQSVTHLLQSANLTHPHSLLPCSQQPRRTKTTDWVQLHPVRKKTKLKSCWPHRMSILPSSFNLFQMMKSQSSFPLNRKRSHCCCKTECCDHWTWTCALEKISSKKHQLTSDNSSLLHFTTSVSPRQIQVNHLQKYCTEEQITGLENTANQSKVHPRHFPSRDQSCTLEKEQRKSQCAPWPWSTLQHPLLWKHPQKSCHLHSKLDCSRSNRQAEARWDPAQEDLC